MVLTLRPPRNPEVVVVKVMVVRRGSGLDGWLHINRSCLQDLGPAQSSAACK